MTDYWISDLHFGHKNILEYCKRPWNSVDEMNEGLISNWNQIIKTEDNVFVVGDMMMGPSSAWEGILNRLNGRIHLVKGNHDHKFVKQTYVQSRMVWIKDYYEYRVQDADAENGKNQLIIMQHFAPYVWDESHKGSWALSGHSHGSLDLWHRERLSLDVGVDAETSKYFPISYQQIKYAMSNKNINLVDHHGVRKDESES